MSRTLDLIDNGIKWTVGVMRRAAISNNDMRFVGVHLLQFMLPPHDLCQLRRLPATNRISIACCPVTS